MQNSGSVFRRIQARKRVVGGSRSEVSPVSLIKTYLVRTIQERRAARDVVVLLKAGSSGCLTGGGRYGDI